MKTSPFNVGLVEAVSYRGGPLPKPNEDYAGWQMRDWVRGWNAGVAGSIKRVG